MDAKSPTKNFPFWWLLIAIPVGIHFFLLYRYSVNAPRLDDFSEVLTFLPNFHAASTWQEKLRVFFAVYQDHRYGITHIINLLTDGINFRHYVLWGNLLLPAYVFLIWRALQQHKLQKEITFIAALLFFNLQTWYGTYWASILLTSLGSLPVALGTFLLVCSTNPRLLPCALFSAICLTYTLGNGIFVWPLAAAYSLLDNHRKQQLLWNTRTLSWLIAGAIVLIFYFHDFHFFNKEGHGGLDAINFIQQAINNIPNIAIGFFSLAGSHLLYYSGQIDWRITLASTIGVIETVALIWLLWRGALRAYPALRLLLAFVFFTMLSIAVARAATINIGQALQGHYKLYPATYLLLLITAILDWLTQRKSDFIRQIWGIFLCLTAAMFAASLYLFVATLAQYNQDLAKDIKQWLYSNTLKYGETRLYVKQPNKKLTTAVDGGFYNPWTLLQDDEIPDDLIYSDKCPPSTAMSANIESHAHAHAVKVDIAAPATTQQVCLQGGKQAIYFTINAGNQPQSSNTSLWVPRNSEVTEDAGPWTLYALP